MCLTKYFYLGTLAKEISNKYKDRQRPKNYQPTRTALDDMLSLDRLQEGKTSEIDIVDDENTKQVDVVSATVSKDPFDYSSDSSGQGTRFAKRTGNFDLDFPDSPRMPKMRNEQSKKSTRNLTKISEVMTEKENNIPSGTESDTRIEPSGVTMIKRHDSAHSSDIQSETGDSSMENITFRKRRNGKKRGECNFNIFINIS